MRGARRSATIPGVTLATAAALLGAAVVLATGFAWFRRIHAVRLPADRTPFVALMATGAVLGVAAFAAGVGWLAGLLAGFAALAGSVFVALVAISAQKGGTGVFAIGRPVPDFTAPDDTGKPFSVSSQAGRPLLIKFFRGHW